MTTPMATPQPPDANAEMESLTFEEAFRRLGETAEQLEAGGLPLAEAVAVYELGMALVQHCNRLLNNTQLKITQLQEAYSGSAAVDDLDWDEETDD